VLNPLTWSAMRRTKDSQNRYLVTPDPTAEAVNQLWGVEVLVTTVQAAGTGLLIDTSKFGRVLVREGLSLRTGSNNDDFTHNLVRFVGEERLALAVESPCRAAVHYGLAYELTDGSPTMKVKVLQPFQASHEGTIYRPGDTADVPDQVAAHWRSSGWVEEVGVPKRKPAGEPAAQGE
jgi:Phage capsid family